MMTNQMSQGELLHWIDMVSFVVVDMTLYLDSHPQDEDARQICQKYLDMRMCAMKDYAQKYGPLTVDTATADSPWNWENQPLPWEGGCR